MEYRRLGGSGLKVSALSFGAWVTFGEQVGDDTARDLMRTAREAGVNFFDNAETYAHGEAEAMMGRVIQQLGWKRSDLVLSTKIFWGGDGPNDRGLSHKHLVEGTLAALDRLQTSYVDLIFCHRPDLDTPIEETVRAMSQLIDRGLAFYWGTSEWSADQIRDAYGIARREHLVPPTMEQPQYNMFTRERVEKEYARLYDDIGLGLTTFSPLASGNLAGKYLDGVPKGTRLDTEGYEYLRKQLDTPRGRDRIEKVKRLIPIAGELGASMAQLAIAWAVRNPRVSTVITGASRPAQITENMRALELSTRLGPDVLARIEAVLENRPKPETDFRLSN
jgi:voltage-dependent potassium channel beta subunit